MSLDAFRDYCRQMSEDEHLDPGDRELWEQQAAELDDYLARRPDDDDGSLF